MSWGHPSASQNQFCVKVLVYRHLLVESSCEVLGYYTALYIFNKATWAYNIKANIHFARVMFFLIFLYFVAASTSYILWAIPRKNVRTH